MSAYPPYPGSKSNSSTPTPSNLPARPPPPAGGPPRGSKPTFSAASTQSSSYAPAGASGFTGFAPRAVAGGQPYRTASPVVAAGPQPPSAYGVQAAYSAGFQQGGHQQQGYYGQVYQEGFTGPTPPSIRNPFAPPTAGSIGPVAGPYGAQQNVDPDMEAQIAQWQSAYAAKDDSKNARTGVAPGSGAATGANSGPVNSKQETDQKGGTDAKPKTVQRSGGGEKWNDSTLLEWDPAHFRLFVGNLAGEVTDESLLKAFAKYTSIQKARVIRDKRTTKSKGFGFVSFSDGDDYFRAGRDMQGKYIGSHPIAVRKSTTEIKPVTQKDPRQQHRKGGKGGGTANPQAGSNGVLSAHTGAGVGKKQAKTKGGLKILG